MLVLVAACVGGFSVTCATVALIALSMNQLTRRSNAALTGAKAPQVSRWLTRIAARTEPLTTWNYRHRVSVRLQRAGLQNWRPVHVFMLQIVVAVTITGVAAVLLLPVNGADGASREYALPMAVTVGQSLFFGLVAWMVPQFWLRWLRDERQAAISAAMPSFLDLLCLGLDCGMNLQGSIQLAIEHLPRGPLRTEWNRMLLDMRSGMARPEALRQLAERADVTVIRHLVSTLAQGERAGLSLARILTDFACNERARRMLSAEKQAMRAPVKMLLPLALCIFPCTFLILGFPVMVVLAGMN